MRFRQSLFVMGGLAVSACAVLLWWDLVPVGAGPDPDAATVHETLTPSPPAASVLNTVIEPLHDRSTRTSDRQGLTTLREEIVRLRADVESLRRSVQEQKLALARVATEGDTEDWHGYGDRASFDAELDHAEAVEEAKLEWQLYMDTVEASFQRQPTDPAWSAEATDVIHNALEDENVSATSLDEVECRSQLCRVTVRHAEPMAASRFGASLPPELDAMFPNLTMEHIDEGGGESITIVYLSGEGYSWPDPDSGE